MILYSSRSAKSVACSRLNVIGVSAFFFLPVLVAALARADEFHSVTNTRWPSALSHFASRPSWVVFPDPSIPSTTNSLPGYSCGCVRLFNIGMRGRLGSDAADLDAQGFSGHSFERCRMARGGPQLELDIAGSPQLQQVIVSTVVQLQPHHRLGVAAIQAFSEAKNRGKRAHRAPPAASEVAEAVVPPLRRRLAMVAGDQRNRLDLVRLEAAQVAVLDQVVRVFVVSFVADVHAQVVEDGGVLQPLALAVRQAVNRARVIEESDRQPRHLLRVRGPALA